jgi:hypothetical protein
MYADTKVFYQTTNRVNCGKFPLRHLVVISISLQKLSFFCTVTAKYWTNRATAFIGYEFTVSRI